MGGGRTDGKRLRSTPLGKATASPVRRSAFVQFSRVAWAFRLVSGGEASALSNISVDDHEQRSTLDSGQPTDSTTHARTQADSLSSPATVCTRPLLQTCPPPGTFTTLTVRHGFAFIFSHPVIYRFNGCFIVCSLLTVLPINHRHRRHQRAIIFNIIITVVVI